MRNLFQSSNPTFNNETFSNVSFGTGYQAMTISGAVNKTIFSILLVIAGGAYSWYTPNSMSLLFPAGIIGFIVALVTIFKKQWSPYTVPFYALVEGVFLGALSLMIENKVISKVDEYGHVVDTPFTGIVQQAVALTFVVFFIMLFLYKFKVIRVTEKFKSIIISSTLAIGAMYLIFWIMSMFGAQPFIYGNSIMSIGFSIFVIAIASMNLLMDFDLLEKGAENGSPKYMEWYSAFGILVTLIWLYIEILRLLSKLRSR